MVAVSTTDDIHRITADEYLVMSDLLGWDRTELIEGVVHDGAGVHGLTADEYLAVAEALGWERTELVEGVVYDMAAQYDLHGGTAAHVYDLLKPLFPDDLVRFGLTVRLSASSVPDPDVLVIDGSRPFNRMASIPAELVKLVVEVSTSTQSKDLGPKMRAYAAAGIPEYWVVDPWPAAGYLLRHTRPVGGLYAEVRRYDVGEGAKGLDAARVLAGEP